MSAIEGLTEAELEQFRPGIYLHFKGGLYEATHLTQNASEDNRVEVNYAALGLSAEHEGFRHWTREFREFLFDQVHLDGTRCVHPRFDDLSMECSDGQLITPRFQRLGPFFEASMLTPDTRP